MTNRGSNMHLVQFLLPLYDNEGLPFPSQEYDQVFEHLAQTFGGATAYQRSPAKGAWKEEDGVVNRDEMVVYEVMVEDLDRAWWRAYGQELAQRFRQEEILMRATPVEKL